MTKIFLILVAIAQVSGRCGLLKNATGFTLKTDVCEIDTGTLLACGNVNGSLDLSNCNISSMQMQANPQIRNLLLNHNPLQSLNLTAFPNISGLSLINCNITTIPPNTFSSKILMLSLDANPLQLTSNSLASLTNLNILSLRSCKLTKVPPLPAHHLFLGGNPWDCCDEGVVAISTTYIILDMKNTACKNNRTLVNATNGCVNTTTTTLAPTAIPTLATTVEPFRLPTWAIGAIAGGLGFFLLMVFLRIRG